VRDAAQAKFPTHHQLKTSEGFFMGTMPSATPLLTPDLARFMRRLGGLTLQKLADESGVQKAQLCRYEMGQRPLRDEQLARIDRVVRKAIAEREEEIAQVRAGDVRRAAVGVAS
jgi:predicted transcriptional regulator